MAEEEYEDAFDFKKIGAIAVGIIIAVVAATILLGIIKVDIPTIPEIELPEINIETEQPSQQQQQQPETVVPTPESPIIEVEDKRDLIKPEYEKYIDFGITIDDIVDIQFMPCLSFEEGNFSQESKYIEIFKQRRSEC